MEETKDISLNFVDNFLSKKEHEIVLEYCVNANYRVGEVDLVGLPPTGMIHEIPETEFVYKLFRKRITEGIDIVRDMKIYRAYVNCFCPGENPFFHDDGGGITFLYYPNVEWNLQWGGETQFVIDNNIQGVLPIPNRMVFFDGQIVHRATSFRDEHRFTVAIKFQPSK